MSKYTTEVRFICETSAGLTDSTGYSKIDEVITSAIPKIFDFDFPIFDETYRSVLETKILKHYYTREIGEETVGLWKLRLNTRLNEIMPYYNKLYQSELLSFNPLYDVDITRDHKVEANGTKVDTGEITGNTTETRELTGTTSGTGKTTGTTTGTENVTTSNTSDSSNTRLELHSDTPQGGISNIQDGDYLTDIKKITDDGTVLASGVNESENSGTSNTETENSATYEDTATSTGESTGTSKLNSVLTNTEDYLEHVSGKQGTTSYSKMLQEYRQTFLNIDMSVIMELKDLFMNLW